MDIEIKGFVAKGDEPGQFVLSHVKVEGFDFTEFVIHDTGIGWLWAALVGEEIEIEGWVEATAPGVITPLRITVP